MKFTFSWLKDHLETDASLEDVCKTLTRIGLEVEGVENPGERLKNFVVAAVLEAERHPNADRLRVCKVDFGSGAPVQVVCGAPNARAGMKSVFSPPGTYIPGKNITIAKGNIRGVDSFGMLCSAAELEISEDHDGILDLPTDAPIGQNYADFAGLDDPVIDVALTPNRPDAAGVAGLARDLAAAGLGRLKAPQPKNFDGAFACPVGVTLDLANDAFLCPQFALRFVRGVKNGPSPYWMQQRLRAIGLRPISALVDITNYITFDRGRPLHVFDARKISGDLVVRRAKTGEEILALDGKTYSLHPHHVVIADHNGVESIAGIMGGEKSGCDDQTCDVLIESALWDALNIARTGRELGASSDARYRFERGVDPASCILGLDLATQMILDCCGGEPSQKIVVGDGLAPPKPIAFKWSEVMRLTGLKLDTGEMAAILTKLGFAIEDETHDGAKITAPSWRPDIAGPADLVEEITRIAGLDRVAATPLERPAGVAAPVLTPLQKRAALARRALAARGFVEAVTYSFISERQAKLFGGGAPTLKLSNPISAEMSDMRPSLLPGLIAAAQRNADRGFSDVALFEVGQVFLGDGERDQFLCAAGVRRGAAKFWGADRNWRMPSQVVDAFDAKEDLFALLAALGAAPGAAQLVPDGPSFLHPGRCASLQFGPKLKIGFFGEIHPKILADLGVEGPMSVFEATLDLLPAPKAKASRAKAKLELSPLMALRRDFAFLAARETPAQDFVKAIAGIDRQRIADVAVFDVYEGAGVPEGQKSLAIAVTLQPTDKTLSDQDIEAISSKIVAAAGKFGGVLRA